MASIHRVRALIVSSLFAVSVLMHAGCATGSTQLVRFATTVGAIRPILRGMSNFSMELLLLCLAPPWHRRALLVP